MKIHIGHQNIPYCILNPPFAGLLHQANGSRARLLPTYSTQPNTMVIYDGYLTSSSSLSVPYLGVKTSMNSHSNFFDAVIYKIFPHLTWCPWPKGYFESIFHNWEDHGPRMPREENLFTEQPKIHSHPKIFKYGRSIFCLPHHPTFLDIFDLCLHWLSLDHWQKLAVSI